jgi:hypothetical protein
VRLVSGGTVTNHGLISSARTGVSFGDTAGTFVNFGSIVSTAPLSGTVGSGVYLAAGGAITNAARAAISAQRDAVSIGNTFATSAAAIITNQGTLTGNIGLGVGGADTGNNTLVNAGTITGTGGTAVEFGAGSNLLTVDPGAVFSGIVLGGSSSNALELASGAGTGALAGIGTNFVDFTAVDVDASAVWLLSGANTLAAGSTLSVAGTVQDGADLVVGGSFVDTGLVTIESGAALELRTGGVGSGGIAFVASGDFLKIGSAGAPATLANPITGFAQGDTIDMAGLVANGDSYAGGVLTLTNSGNVVAQLTVATPVANPVFTLGTDGNGGTLIRVQSGAPNLFDFVFTYDGGADYYYGTVADNGSFGYFVNDTFALGGGAYDIFSQAGTTTEAPGTVFVTYYSHGGPGQASYTPALTAAGESDGTLGLGSESDTLLGTDGLQHPFSASLEASFTTDALFGFVYTYADGTAYYSGTVADNGSLGYAAVANSSSPYLPGADGYYYIFSEGVTGEPSGTVTINDYRDGATAMTYSTTGGGSGGLGSESGSFLDNGATFDFGPTQEATDPLSATMVLRDGSNGDFDIYDLGNNAILGHLHWAK